MSKDEAMKLEMVDDEGENRAVRMFLALYGGACGVTVDRMRKHLKMSGFDGAWPDWANDHNGHLTKAGAQLWIRHLFALAEQPAQQEPVYLVWLRAHCAWMHTDKESFDKISDDDRWVLYTSPPAQRTWVRLTNNELQPIANEYRILFGSWVEDFARAIEAKLKEKNT